MTTTETEAHTAVARHYPGPEFYVHVYQVGRWTWAVDVAEIAP